MKGIIWDFGNILARFDHLKACRKFAQYSHISPEDIFKLLFSGDNAPTKLHESGKLSSQEFFLAVKEIAYFSEELSFQEFCVIWKDIFQENKGIEKVINRIRPDVKQCILSNTDPIHWSAIEQLPIMRQHFSDPRILVRSYTAGTRKPDPKIYKDALTCLGFTEKDIGQVLYIDDVADYRTAFERMGGNTLAYDCSKNALAQLEAGLEESNVLLRV